MKPLYKGQVGWVEPLYKGQVGWVIYETSLQGTSGMGHSMHEFKAHHPMGHPTSLLRNGCVHSVIKENNYKLLHD